MNLLLLPPEVQLEIIRNASPPDAHNLALTCKQLLSLAKTVFAERHYQLRKAYYKVDFVEKPRPAGTQLPLVPRTIADLLCQIATDPQIAQYIVHLNLYKRDIANGDDWEGESLDGEDEDDESGHAHPLRKLIRESEYIAQLDYRPGFTDELFDAITEEDEDIDTALVFLFTLLPNLESIALDKELGRETVAPDPSAWPRESWNDAIYQFRHSVRDLVALLVERANDETLTHQPLSKLRVLHPTQTPKGQYGDNMLSIIPFLTLKSLRKATNQCGFCDLEEDTNAGEDDDDDEQPDSTAESRSSHDDKASPAICSRYPVLGPNLESLTLDSCAMDAPACEAFFRNMKHLKTLHFSYDINDWYGNEWDIEGFVRNLANAVGSTLETLVMTVGRVNNDSHLISSDMHGFQVLKHMELSTVFFVNGMGSVGAEYAHYADDPNPDHVVRPLLELLPPSLESFKLDVPCCDLETVKELFRDFQEKRGEVLPKLSRVELYVCDQDSYCRVLPDAEAQKIAIKEFAGSNGLTCVYEDLAPPLG